MPRAPACLSQCAAWAMFRPARHLHSPQTRRLCRAGCRRPGPSGARRDRPSPATRRGWPGGWVACSGTVLSLSGAVRWERCTLQLKTRQTMSILTPSHMPRARWAAKPDTRGAKAETRGARRRNIGDGARTCGRGRWRGWRGGTMQRPYRKTCQRRPDGREPESDCGGRIGAAAIPDAGGAVNADRSSRPSLPCPPS